MHLKSSLDAHKSTLQWSRRKVPKVHSFVALVCAFAPSARRPPKRSHCLPNPAPHAERRRGRREAHSSRRPNIAALGAIRPLAVFCFARRTSHKLGQQNGQQFARSVVRSSSVSAPLRALQLQRRRRTAQDNEQSIHFNSPPAGHLQPAGPSSPGGLICFQNINTKVLRIQLQHDAESREVAATRRDTHLKVFTSHIAANRTTTSTRIEQAKCTPQITQLAITTMPALQLVPCPASCQAPRIGTSRHCPTLPH